MNRLTNSFLLVLFFPTLLISLFVGFDFPIEILRTSGANLPYKSIIFLVLGILISLLSINRSVKRWVSLYTISQKDRFVYHVPISLERTKRVRLYTLLEAALLLLVGIALFSICSESIFCAMAYALFGIDDILFLIFGSNRFGVGMSKKAIIIADREVIVLYFSGLRKVSISQRNLFFDYLQDLQLTFPVDCIPEDKRNEFLTNLESVTDKDRVFIQNLGEWKM